MTSRTDALLLSAYDAPSHRRWRTGLVEHLPEYNWTTLTLPPRHFRWRIRGNSLSWAFSERDVLTSGFDLVVATSMVDLSALRGLVPELADAHTVVYFHENQFAYPKSAGQSDNAGPGVVNLYGALCADRVAFNSRYNLDSFVEGSADFLDLMPDCIPDGIIEQLEARATVVAVPLDDELFGEPAARPDPAHPDEGPLSIVWNHRWEYDKAPERFFEALFLVADEGLDFELHVVGQRFRQAPEIFATARQRLADHIATWGYVERRADYRALLRRADLVVSTSMHEFQGLAMLEAIALGCRPLAPARLAYPEYIPESWLYESTPDDPQREAAAVARRLGKWCAEPALVRRSPPVDVGRYRWSSLADRYRGLLDH
jgi:glycosyltransferase involved in cell wall biosynthesis